MKILETNRLTLRLQTTEDVEFILELLNDPSWLQFIGDRGVKTIDDARNYIMNGPIRMYEQFGFCLYLVERKEDQIPIGICGLVKRDTLEDVDIGFAFLPKYWEKGYAYEAASAVMAYGKDTLGLNRIVAITTQDNHPSAKLLEKVGLQFERLVQLSNDPEELRLFAYNSRTENHINNTYKLSDQKISLDRLTDAFFNAFTNKNGEEPNVRVLNDLFIPEGMIIKNTDSIPNIYNLQQFIDPREKLLREGRLTDFKEEEIQEITEIFGNIAHRFSLYRKSGVLDGDSFETLGMKTMQFIQTPSGWKISSVAWDDERNGLAIPERYRN
ncbi:ribosomal-protein-alanine acetyltransferase [Bacillus pseudomycoides]|nr:ribosomal-protein-alanine acetyltransferase [Bacillus pseudomycoides]PFZ11531.1 ribosomal-protein-alanine acetyltransferase [Bacillus pseudomycoides]PGC32590.1 ribosomal-protein-alanine acetyltransferase [Bacillus pseudomycoides]